MKDATFLKRLRLARDIPHLRAVCEDFARDAGFAYFLYGLRLPTSLAEPRHLTISNYPRFWQRRYQEKAYLRIDPVVAHTVESIAPVFWDELDCFAPDIVEFRKDAAEFGLVDGLTVPVYGRGCEIGMFNVARSEVIARSTRLRMNLLRRTQWFAVQVHLHARDQLLGDSDLPITADSLKTTEKECLLWLAEGKAMDQIARQLDIEPAAVVRHLDSATAKLGVKDHQTAIARAVALGEISPPSYLTRSKSATPHIDWLGTDH